MKRIAFFLIVLSIITICRMSAQFEMLSPSLIGVDNCEPVLIHTRAFNWCTDNPCMERFVFLISQTVLKGTPTFSHDFVMTGFETRGSVTYMKYEATIQMPDERDENIDVWMRFYSEAAFLPPFSLVVAEAYDDDDFLIGSYGVSFESSPLTSIIGMNETEVKLSEIAIRDLSGNNYDNPYVYTPEISPQVRQFWRLHCKLIVDIDYELKGRIFFMNEQAQVEVDPGVHFTFRNWRRSDLNFNYPNANAFSCDGSPPALTDPFIVNGTFEADDIILEGFHHVITANPGSKVIARNVTFRSNVVGIYAEYANLIDVYNTQFVSTVGHGDPPSVYNHGIFARNTDNILVDFSVFDNIGNGIYSEDSKLYVKSSLFSNIRSGTNGYLGKGIFALGLGKSNTSVMGDNVNGLRYCEFVDCDQGVEVIGHGLRMKLALMNNVDEGVFLRFNRVKRAYIKNSILNCNNYAIRLNNSRIPTNITENQIHIDGNNDPQNAGIIAESSSNVGVYQYNEIFLKNASKGVFFTDSKGAIKENDVTLESPMAEFRGVELLGCQDVSVGCNIITGSSSAETNSFGFYTVASEGVKMYCNSPSNVEAGYRFVDMNEGTDFKVNEMNGAYGLQVEYEGVMDVQEHHFNCWSFVNPGATAYNYNTSSDLVRASRFLVDGTKTCLMPVDPKTDAGQGVGWFKNESTNQSLSCSSGGCTPPGGNGGGTGGGQGEGWYGELIRGELGFSTFSVQRHWSGQRQLFDLIAEGTVALSGSGPVDSFYQAQTGEALDLLHAVDAGISSFGVPDESVSMQMESWDAQMEDAWENIITWTASEDTVLSETALTGIDDELAVLQTVDAQYNPVISALINDQNQTLSVLTQTNASITDPFAMAGIRQTVNAEVLDVLLQPSEDLPQTSITALSAIADMCPVEGGQAVYRARNLLSMAGYAYDETQGCPANGQRIAAKQEEHRFPGVQVFPQPGVDAVQIIFQGQKPEGPVHWTVYDQTGNTMLNGLWKDVSPWQIDIRHLTTGLYLLHIDQKSSGLSVYRRMVVMH